MEYHRSMADPFLPYGRHDIDEEDVAAVAAVLRGDWLTGGPAVGQFEAALAERVGARYAVACSSGTAGLHLAAMAAGLGPGDKVIIPTLTFLATANAARYVGADVVFADVDATTGLLGEAEFKSAMTRASGRTRAVFPVHLAGQTVDMRKMTRLAREHGLILVEDACHALGTTFLDGNASFPVGACRYSDMAVFSFHPVKTIAMGEGGAITTNNRGLYERLIRLRSHGMVREVAQLRYADLAFDADRNLNPWYYEMPEIGFNYRASDVHCALALSQLKKLDRFVSRRRELADIYDRLLAPLAPVVAVPRRVPDCNPAWHLYAVKIDFATAGIERAKLMHQLRSAGIGTQVHYIPVHLQPYYRQFVNTPTLPGATAYYQSVLSLPLFPSMTDADVEGVVDNLSTILRS